MATRNRTHEFREYRDHAKSRKRGGGGYSDVDEVHVNIDGGESYEGAGAFSHVLPPEWVDIVETIEKDLGSIRDYIQQLQRRHTNRLKVKFDDDEIARQEKEIEEVVQIIIGLLRKSENGLKRIATVGNARGANLPQQERSIRLNVMRNLATQLQTLSKQFRHAQKDFLMRLKGQESYSKNGGLFGDDSDDLEPLSIEAAERGFTDSEQAQLQSYEQAADERHQEIIKIVQSINDLATLFRELSVLVIEQGTILDRIDYNVEQTLVKVQKGTKELEVADKYSKKNKMMKCILFLILIVLILIFAVVIKYSSGDNQSTSEPANSDPTKP